jgi:hypothetical protein
MATTPLLWGNLTKISGSGHHPFPLGPAGLCNTLDGTGNRYIDCQHWSVYDDTLLAISNKCKTTLIELIIHTPHITDVSPLSALEELRRLTLINPEPGLLPTGSLAGLSPSFSLYYNYNININNNHPSSFISNMEELNLSGCGSALNDQAMAAIVEFHGQHLRTLNISKTDVGDNGALSIGKECSELLSFNGSYTKIKGKGMNSIMAGNMYLVDVICTHLLHCSGRVSLVEVRTDKVQAFSHTLITLCLKECDSVRNACCYWISTFVSLKELDVSSCTQLSDSGMVELSKLTQLQRL